MTAERVYDRDYYDPWSRTERCQAQTHPRRRAPQRCGNRAPSEGPTQGLCWRHR